jgi:hypothetical protein
MADHAPRAMRRQFIARADVPEKPPPHSRQFWAFFVGRSEPVEDSCVLGGTAMAIARDLTRYLHAKPLSNFARKRVAAKLPPLIRFPRHLPELFE